MKLGNSAIIFIFITLLIDVIGLGIIIPILPALMTELTGESVAEASAEGGWLMFAYAIMTFLFSPILGNLSDRYGRRPIILFSLLGLGIDYLFMAYAPSLTWLFVGRIVSGIMGASFTTASAYIADISTPEKRAQNFGLVGAAFGLGFIIGPVIGGLLGGFGSRIPFFAAAALSLINFIYGVFVLPESLSEENRRPFEWKRANPFGALKTIRKHKEVAGIVLSLFFLYWASFSVQGTWSYYTKYLFNWSESEIGYSLAAVGFMAALVQGYLIRKINPKLGNKKSIVLGILLYTSGLVLFSMANEGWMMYAILIPYCLGGITIPAMQSEMAKYVPANEQGELQGALTAVNSITAIIGPVSMTGIFAYFASTSAPFYFPGAAFFAGAILCAISAWIAFVSFKKQGS
jgi:DHA1 family tetracycline resistance protein-like MFS transporter